MRIIAGKYKNRLIPSLKASNYRPSTAKFREALFSILSSGEFANQAAFMNADILDLFAGTGSLSFEALSRGAKTITLVDNNKGHIKLAKDFADEIGQQGDVKLILADATSFAYTAKQYDLVFMDPPYHSQLVEKSLINLIKNKLLKEKAIIAVEIEKREELEIPENIFLLKEKVYGNNKLLILEYGSK
jgi:16S rRNA (guanine966-N2)-methyltransferase